MSERFVNVIALVPMPVFPFGKNSIQAMLESDGATVNVSIQTPLKRQPFGVHMPSSHPTGS